MAVLAHSYAFVTPQVADLVDSTEESVQEDSTELRLQEKHLVNGLPNSRAAKPAFGGLWHKLFLHSY